MPLSLFSDICLVLECGHSPTGQVVTFISCDQIRQEKQMIGSYYELLPQWLSSPLPVDDLGQQWWFVGCS